ncbi:hypothetical protein FSB78_16515 [Sphingomonas ginsenosidivorax]|uniref:Uncharacterized protein n=1 Tax=Sphingomonas ginsenosidivorax TaxID=862135 RepID=A0A5C6UI47_9SPHN|nr:hypothetical protein [Sphingomonas ginsenosidivorax]TXC72369.1 hypothetical protein FSB78_16515 [Sphingomonas ginsenosidivorax]
MNWIVPAAGAAALVVLGGAGVTWRALRRPVRIDTPEEVAEATEAALRGFAVRGAVVGADGQGALAMSGDGRVAAARRLRRRLVVREVAWRDIRSTAGGILVETNDRALGAVTLTGIDVLDIRRLAP